jgi:hypothetical protein
MRRLAVALATILALALPAIARAETRRLAILVGSNSGSSQRPALRFAEEDAERLAGVLTELGGLDPTDLWLLKAATPAIVRGALDQAARRVASWRHRPDQRVVLLFYFSGHSDGQALELGSELLPFAEVRALMAGSGADVRLAILDSCRAGGLLAAKGGTPGPGFDVKLSDNLASAGEAFITSSAADETALESSEIRGSFFSHHFVSGLRGAADASGDGQVTLDEAYQYAFSRTVSATAGTVIGPQHPVYDYRLSGRGDLVLTRLRRPAALIEAPAGFERLLVIEAHSRNVVVELGPRAARRVAVPAGRYQLLGWRGGRMARTEVVAAPGESHLVDLEAFTPVDTLAARGKGGAEAIASASPAPVERRALALLAAAGVEGPVADSLRVLPALRLALSLDRGRSPTLALDLASGRGAGFRETRAELLVGLEQRWTTGRLRFGAGAELGGGVATQTDSERTRTSGVASAALTSSLALALSRPLALVLLAQAPLHLVRLEGTTAWLGQPAAWLGLVLHP